MGFKFEKLEVWNMALEYTDAIYKIVAQMPSCEEFNLKSQIIRAVTSISLNIAEGSTTQSNPEYARFLSMSIRSCVEVIACLHLARRRNYITQEVFESAYEFGDKLFAKLQALRKTIKKK
ncbi:MAG TPA: four helix bundle protein [Ignavibacteria bacterium]|nr:four helix bundle protein [Ignavibacteria bacterium]